MLGRLYSWYGKTMVRGVLAFIIILIGAGFYFSRDKAETLPEKTEAETVTLQSVASLSEGTEISIIGTVEAVNEAVVESEVGGRITSVPVELGDAVRAGQVIAQLENASERAAVLQAEGAYEAAVASQAQSEVGTVSALTDLESAKRTGLNTYRTAFTTVDDIVHNLVDELFSNPESYTPGFRLSSQGQANELNAGRSALTSILHEWESRVFASPDQDDALEFLTEAERDTARVAEFVNKLAGIVSHEDNEGETLNETTIEEYQTRFLTARANLNTTLQNIETAQAAIVSAEEALETAELRGTSRNVSASDAQVKQALGGLRAAEANLEKTIIRAPIAGAINVLNVKTGNFVGPRSEIALVASNNALIVTAYVGEVDRDRIEVGNTVGIDGESTGTVTNIAPAVDPATGKIEVQISVLEAEGLSNGDTVRVSILDEAEESTADTQIVIPFSALKITPNGPVAFTVSNESALVANPVVLGEILGDRVAILEGLSPQTQIVTDARGLSADDIVEVNNQNNKE